MYAFPHFLFNHFCEFNHHIIINIASIILQDPQILNYEEKSIIQSSLQTTHPLNEYDHNEGVETKNERNERRICATQT